MTNRRELNALVFVFIACSVCRTSLAEWPMYGADVRRSGVSHETIELPLVERWKFEAGQLPRPAWPDPVKERHRLDFDHAPQVVMAAKAVFFGSSADDTLRALDAQTGQLRWTFTTGGPIRFAPVVDDGRVYAASDDGHLYCLQAATGKLIWDFNAAGDNDQVLGNGRLISRWPLRSGVLVDRGVAYVTAGMWPSDGVMIYALDAATGKVLWCNDTCDTIFLAQPHAQAYSLTGVSPQGYLLATDELLLVPTGRGVPAAFDRKTGELRYFKPADSKTHGGSWSMIAGDRLFNGGLVYECATGEQITCPTTKVPLWAKRDFDFGTRQHVLGYRGDRVIANGDRIIGRRTGRCLALANDVLLEGGDGVLSAFDANSKNSGTVLWEAKLRGEVRSIAISDGAVFASTDRGTVHCFANGNDTPFSGETKATVEVADSTAFGSPLNESNEYLVAVERLANEANITKGYAVVIEDITLAESIARKGELHVVCLVKNDDEIAALRKRFVESGIYGSRIVVKPLVRLRNGDYPPYFANLIVVGAGVGVQNVTDLWRMLRPCGGLVCFEGESNSLIEKIVSEVEDPPTKKGESNGIAWLRRGKLPGAFDWDSGATADQRVEWPLELAWFGGPGPARMQDRHRAAIAPPVVANGRYFVPGELHIIAVDAYNGTELWSRQFSEASEDKKKQLRLTGLCADDDFAYYKIGGGWLRLDAQTGDDAGKVEALPDGLQSWGRIAKREQPFATYLREHALTGENVPRVYYRAYGCNQLLVSDGVDFFRSGTLGLYDLNDDSGLRNFGGMRPGCWRSHNAAFGVFLSSEGSSGCRCTYNFQTSLMLAPARKRRHEDWAIYYDLPADGLIRQMRINLGAPGDRRDGDGNLWMSWPRPSESLALQLPVSIEVAKSEEHSLYQFDADRRAIQNTQLPWIFASGYQGIRRVTIALDQQQPIVSHQTKSPPQIDGKLAGDEWPEEPQSALRPVHNRQSRGAPNRRLIDPKQWQCDVHLSHDDSQLYIMVHQPNRVDRRGQPYQWRRKSKGNNAPVWIDDSFEFFLSDKSHETVLHFGASASGATYDARCRKSDERESAAWEGKWQVVTSADDTAFVAELAIPWTTITEAGLVKERLMINAQSNWAGWTSPLRFLGSRGRVACENFTPLGLSSTPESPERRFRVRLHFVDPYDSPSTLHRFDVRLQGRDVLSNFDVRSEAGAPNTAIIKEFNDVLGSDSLTIELVPKGSPSDVRNETILSGIEIEETHDAKGLDG